MRAAYTVDMRFWRDSQETVKVRWYRTTKPFLDCPTIFNSELWDDDNGPHSGVLRGQLLQGEQIGPTPFNSGNPPAALATFGPRCGTAAQFNGDLLVDRDFPLSPDINGNPTCCTGLPAGHWCRIAEVPTPDVWYVQLPEMARTLFCAGWLGGVYRLHRFLSPCMWTVDFPVYDNSSQWRLVLRVLGSVGNPNKGAIAVFRVIAEPPTTTVTYFRAGGVDWTGDVALPMTAAVTCAAYVPPSITFTRTVPMLEGSIIWDAGITAVPAGYLLCDGSAVSRTTYATLFGRVGTTYGPGDGSTTFNLPNLRDRFPVGSGMTYGTGDTGGAASVVLTAPNMPTHNHGVLDPGHQHYLFGGALGALLGSTAVDVQPMPGGGAAGTDTSTLAFFDSVANTGILTANAGSDVGHENRPPYMGLRPLIFAGV